MSGQNGDKKVEDHLFKVNIIIPGLEYEMGLSQKTTLNLRLGTGFAYVKTNNDDEFGVFLTGEAAYRYYYNFGKRARKGKNTNGNSANYMSLTTFFQSGDAIIGDLQTDYLMQVGPTWGFQRTYKSGFNLGLDLGAGYVFTNTDGYVSPIINFQIGWAFGK